LLWRCFLRLPLSALSLLRRPVPWNAGILYPCHQKREDQGAATNAGRDHLRSSFKTGGMLSLAKRCLSLTPRCLSLITLYLVPTTRCLGLTIQCLGLTTRCLGLTTRCLGLTLRCLGLTTRCLGLITRRLRLTIVLLTLPSAVVATTHAQTVLQNMPST